MEVNELADIMKVQHQDTKQALKELDEKVDKLNIAIPQLQTKDGCIEQREKVYTKIRQAGRINKFLAVLGTFIAAVATVILYMFRSK